LFVLLRQTTFANSNDQCPWLLARERSWPRSCCAQPRYSANHPCKVIGAASCGSRKLRWARRQDSVSRWSLSVSDIVSRRPVPRPRRN